jgi:hypothetical protein
MRKREIERERERAIDRKREKEKEKEKEREREREKHRVSIRNASLQHRAPARPFSTLSLSRERSGGGGGSKSSPISGIPFLPSHSSFSLLCVSLSANLVMRGKSRNQIETNLDDR